LIRIANNFNEFYLFFKIFIDFISISNSKGSISEVFYGMKRSRYSFFSIVHLCLVDYLLTKANDFYEKEIELSLQENEEPVEGNLSVKNIFKLIYPYFHLLLGITEIYYKSSFIFERSPYWSPILHFFRIKYSRTNPMINDFSLENQDEANDNLIERLRNMISQSLFKSAKTSFPIILFFLRFMDWYKNSGLKLRKKFNLSPPKPLPVRLATQQ
jgi:hypothetical protein